MTVRFFLVGSFLTAIITWAIWLLIILFLNPVRAGWLGFSLFFLVLFLALASTSGLLGYAARRLASSARLPTYTVRTSLRQGVFLSLFFNLLLILQLIRLYKWWLAVIAIILFISFEFVFLNYDRSAKRSKATSPSSPERL